MLIEPPIHYEEETKHALLHFQNFSKTFEIRSFKVSVQSHNALLQPSNGYNHCGLMNISSLIPVSIISLHSIHLMGEFLGLFRRKDKQMVQEKCPHELINSWSFGKEALQEEHLRAEILVL